MLKLITIMTVLFLANAQNKYCSFLTFARPSDSNSITYAENRPVFAIYGGQTPTLDSVYSTLTWQKITQPALTTFPSPPLYMQYFSTNVSLVNILYSTGKGKVIARMISQEGDSYEDVELYTPRETQIKVKKLTHSTKGNFYAFFYQNQSTVFIGDTTKPQTVEVSIDFPRGKLVSVKWRPGTTDLMISGGVSGSPKNRYFYRYSLSTRSIDDLTWIADSQVVLDCAFHRQTMYFIVENGSGEQEKIWQLDLPTGAISVFAQVQLSAELRSLEVRGNYISGKSSISEHVWRISDRTYLGSYASSMVGNGLSNDGTYLVVGPSGVPTQFNVLKLCSQQEQANMLMRQKKRETDEGAKVGVN